MFESLQVEQTMDGDGDGDGDRESLLSHSLPGGPGENRGGEGRESYVSTGSVDSVWSDEGDGGGKGMHNMSPQARCLQFAAFVVCFALTFGLSFFLVQLASEGGIIMPKGNLSSTWSAMSVRSMVHKRAAVAGRGAGDNEDGANVERGGNATGATPTITTREAATGLAESAGVKAAATRTSTTAAVAVETPPTLHIGGNTSASLRKNAVSVNLRPNSEPAPKLPPKLTTEKASAADEALEEDLTILEKMKSDPNSNGENLDMLGAELENTTALLGDDPRLKEDAQLVKKLRQTLSRL